MTGPNRCHYARSGNYETVAAKRPNVVWGKVDTRSPILWRPVSKTTIANG